MTRLPALALIALPLLAGPAAATDHTVCSIMGSIGYDAAEMRQAGISQRTAANMIAVRIGHAASDGAGSIHERQYLASMVGAAATHILRLTYSLPIYATAMERDLAPVAAGRAVYEMCMEGKL